MEIKASIHIVPKWLRGCLLTLTWLFIASIEVKAQPQIMNYTVKDNHMFIAIGKQAKDAAIDSFTNRYNVRELALKKYIRGILRDSLKILGWKVEIDNDEVFVISKPLFAIDNIGNPADRISYTQKDQTLAERFPAVSSNIRYGYNRFRNKFPFAVRDSVVIFYLRGNNDAKRVMLAGSFNEWKPDVLAMTKTDSGWIAYVKLGPGKYWYKFVADGRWMPDSDNRISENDGLGNTNSVFFKTNHVFRLKGYTDARRVNVAGSFNNWDGNQLDLNNTADGWELPLYLADGTHTYRFVADRRWFEDPANPEHFPNEFGEYNSVIKIGKPRLFTLDGYTDAKQVFLSGTFNGWRKDELLMKQTAKGWELPHVLGPGNYEYIFVVDKKEIKQGGSGSDTKNFYFVIDPNYTFRLKGYPDAKNVYLAGDFNSWSSNTLIMNKDGDAWVFPVHLSPGKHLYKFIVDGKWIIDPDNKLWEQSGPNIRNSVIWIGR